MQKTIKCLLILLFAGLFYPCCQAQQILPQAPETGELITPVNVRPLSIETVARRRGIVTEGPAKNLIIFSCSGMSGASAAFYEAFSQRKRDAVQWQGFQLVYPTWASTGKPGRLNIVKSFNRAGKIQGLVSDNNFAVPGFVHGSSRKQTADLSLFNVSLSFSDLESPQDRSSLVASATGDGAAAGLDLAALEKFFREKSSRFTGCFYSPATMMPGSRSRKDPWVPELVSSLVSRMSMAPEGFCLVVNYSGVSTSRNQGQYCRMIEHMRFQEHILQQLSAFTAGRKDTLLLVVDEPENGVWKSAGSFHIDAFIDDLKKIPAAIQEVSQNFADAEKLLGRHFQEISFGQTDLAKAVAAKDVNMLITLVETAVGQQHKLEFVAATDSGFNSGLTVLAQGLNADVFFGISSFAEFYKRLAVAAGAEIPEN